MKARMMFPGQGSQFVGMGKDYYDTFPEARKLYRQANSKLGFDIAELSFSGDPEELKRTRNLQPAILLHSIVVLEVLASRGVRPSVVAGHSLGEFSALVAAGVFAPMDALLAVRRRGELMYETGLERPGTMAAIIGLEAPVVGDCCRQAGDAGVVVVANFNSPNQLAISGDVDAVDRACELCTEAGAKRALKLPVSGAFHSPLMEPAVPEFRRYLEAVRRQKLRGRWVANVTGSLEADDGKIVELLSRQLSSPVRWTDSMRCFASLENGAVLEVGPGKVLGGLMKRVVDGVDVLPTSTVDDLGVAV